MFRMAHVSERYATRKFWNVLCHAEGGGARHFHFVEKTVINSFAYGKKTYIFSNMQVYVCENDP